MSETAVADEPQLAENIATTKQARSPQLKPYQFNSANARIMAAKANESMRKRKLNEAKQRAELEQIAAKAKEVLIANALKEESAPPLEQEEIYRAKQLKRTRDLLESLYSDFETTNDAKERKFISDSIARLSDVEFALARRPKPAAYRTAPEKPKRSSGATGPVDAD